MLLKELKGVISENAEFKLVYVGGYALDVMNRIYFKTLINQFGDYEVINLFAVSCLVFGISLKEVK